jgi:hypothetical protein
VWVAVRAIDPRTPAAPADRAAATTAGGRPAARVNLVEFELAEDQYEAAAARLLESLESRGDSLPPETRALVDENLRIIDRAIEEVRSALESEPGDTSTGHALNALYRRKVEFLWSVSRLSS